MAIGDWNALGQTGDDVLDDERKYEGTSSLKKNNAGSGGVYIHPDSTTETVTEGRIETRVYVQGQNESIASMYFYYNTSQSVGTQPDAAWRYDGSDATIELNDLSADKNDTVTAFAGGWPSGWVDSWIPIRMDFWQDDKDDLRIQYFHDGDDDGTWTKINSNDVVVSNFNVADGGVGIGGSVAITTTPLWYDETKLFW